MAATQDGICFVGLPGRAVDVHLDDLRSRYPEAAFVEDGEKLREASEQLSEYWSGGRAEFSLSIDIQGTSFQEAVWDYLRQIPFGQTVTYGQVAEAVGSPRAYQAVGRAVGSNPVPLVVPCHRVIGADGSLTGFAAGIDMKRRLLEHEGCLLV